MHRVVFRDRRSAGELLGVEVAKLHVDKPVVLGLPRGGVPVAAEVAAAIDEAVRQWREAIAVKLPTGNDAARKDHEARLTQQGAALRRLLWEPLENRLPSGVAAIYLAISIPLSRLASYLQTRAVVVR